MTAILSWPECVNSQQSVPIHSLYMLMVHHCRNNLHKHHQLIDNRAAEVKQHIWIFQLCLVEYDTYAPYQYLSWSCQKCNEGDYVKIPIMPSKVCDGITYPFLNFNGCNIEV